MKSQQIPCPKAFRVLKNAHRPSCPNEGFRTQLKLFEAMGFRLDLEHPEYRLHKLQHIVDANLATLGEIPLAPAPVRGSTDYSTLLQCRKCRFRVAVDRNVLGHEPGAGQVSHHRTLFTTCLHAGRDVSDEQGSHSRSEERRVGKECRSRWAPEH